MPSTTYKPFQPKPSTTSPVLPTSKVLTKSEERAEARRKFDEAQRDKAKQDEQMAADARQMRAVRAVQPFLPRPTHRPFRSLRDRRWTPTACRRGRRRK